MNRFFWPIAVIAGFLFFGAANAQAHEVIRYHHGGVTITFDTHYYYKAPRVIHRPIRRHHTRHHHWREIPRHYRGERHHRVEHRRYERDDD